MAGSGEVKITCLSCGHKFKPGDGSLKKIDAQGNITYEKQVFVDREGKRWRNFGIIILIGVVIFIFFVYSLFT
jgi:ABC-type multidrug transport system permease subunit